MVSLVERLTHDHDHGVSVSTHETRTRWVVLLTCLMMVGELIVGHLTHSLALTADGWHMATHAGALGMASLAYWFARTRSREAAFSFGTGKVHALAGYTSAIVLAVVALWMMYESASRLLDPVTIAFGEALPVAVVGLLVNLTSVKLLHVGHDHEEHHDDHDHDDHDHHEHDEHEHHDGHDDRHHGDHNLRAAYIHVMADAAVSVLAITGLVLARFFGWMWMDPLAGTIGALVIANWSYGLMRDTGRILLDMNPDQRITAQVREAIESSGARLIDLHLWRLGPGHLGALVSVLTSEDHDCAFYRERLRQFKALSHVTVEVTKAAA